MTTPGRPIRIASLRDTDQGGVAARLTGLPVEVRRLHRAVLHAFLTTGQAPRRDEFWLGRGNSGERAVRQLGEVDLVQLDTGGRVVVAYPFSGRPTGHTVVLDGGPVLHAMCAIDALGIPLMTRRGGVIESTDPRDGHPIRIERRGDTWRWAPADTAVLLAQSSGPGPAADCLCPTTTFHTSRVRAEDHLRGRPELTGVVLEQAQALDDAGRAFGSLLAPDPSPVHAPASAEEPMTTVEMLHTAGCPNAATLLPRLRELVAGAGVAEPVLTRVITDPDEAQRERFLGSPTIRINGRDVDPAAAKRQDYGLSCRLYAGPDGLHGTPPEEWVLTLLTAERT